MRAVATIVCVAFVLYLFWRDAKRPNPPSSGLWVVLCWMFLAGSRWASAWLNLSVPMASSEDYAEGSPLDRLVFFTLIVAGAIILHKRKIDWTELLPRNKWIVLYFLYCLLSIVWTDEPLVLAKRWIKDLGNPIMALLVLTEKRPYPALGVLLRRLAFLWLPLSVLFIKYYPELGRGYRIDGSPMFTGVGSQKNDLGLICLVTGIYFLWRILEVRKKKEKLVQAETIEDLLLLGMMGWLLFMSNSQTSLACLIAAGFLLLLRRIPYVARRASRVFSVGGTVAAVLLILEATFGVKALFVGMLGRDPRLTNRTDVWEILVEMAPDPLVGAGFMSFWTGDRIDAIWRRLGAKINQAHNGYLEQYLNLGYVGIFFIAMIVMFALRSVRRQMGTDPSGAMLRLCFIVTAILYNYTEASFYGINNMWLLLLLACIDIPRRRMVRRSTVRQDRSILQRKHDFDAVPPRV
jgi:exopolysaccharide production protein ExoQ